MAEKFLVIEKIRQTVFFIGEEGNLRQGMDILIENKKDPVRADLDVGFGSKKKENLSIERVEKGRKSYRIYLPEIKEKMKVEFILSANGEFQDKKIVKLEPQRHWNVYLVHLSHHDLGFTNLPTNILREHDGFMDDILRFCEETENWPAGSKFKWTVEQSWSVMHFIENRPKETIDKLIHFIKKGQIEVTAFFASEISELCSHEELIRLLYPSFSLKHKYDIPIHSAGLDDMPGLAWGVATVLAGAGVRYFAPVLSDFFTYHRRKVRTFWDESRVLPRGMPGVFLWQGPDGSEVLLWHGVFDAGGLSWWNYNQALHQLPEMLDKLEKRDYPYDIVRYRFRSGGRDNSPPVLHLSYIVREWNEYWAYPKLVVATNTDFFERLEKKMDKDVPVFRGELPDTDFPIGAISTAKETGINRLTHEELASAEKFATIAASVAKYPYPDSSIEEAYENMILYDEHTWGMSHPIGPAQDGTWSEKSGFVYRAAALSQDILSKSVNKIVDEVKLSSDGCHILIFNPLSWNRTDIVRVPFKTLSPCGRLMHLEYPENEPSPLLTVSTAIGRDIINPPLDITEKPYELIDIQMGERIPYQIVKINSPQAPSPYAASRYALGQVSSANLFEIVFIAKDVPPVGYKTYQLVPSEKAVHFRGNVKVGKASIENRFFKVMLDPETGAIRSIYDKELARQIIDEEAPHKFNQLIVRSAKSGKEEKVSTWRINKGEVGSIYASLVVSGSAFGCPQVTQEIILYDKVKRIGIANRILKDSTPLQEIYFAFPFKMENPTFHFEGCNSVIEPLKDQFPGSNSDYYTMQHWASVSDAETGITLSSIEAPVIEFGGLWPGYVSQAHHGIAPPEFEHDFLKEGDLKKGYMYSYVMNNNFRTNFQPVQVGERLFRYSVTSHKGNWEKAGVRSFGWAFQNPLIPVCMNGRREGTLPSSNSFCQVDEPNVLLLTLKKAEDKDGLIIRLIESKGKNTTARVSLPFISINQAYQTNLVEENQKLLSVQKHEVVVPVKAFGITTIRLQVL